MSTSKIGVLIIHGIGSQKPGYSQPMIDELRDRVGPLKERFVWQEIYWAEELIERETELLGVLGAAQDPDGEPIALEWNKTRNFVFQNFGDAVAYHRETDDGEHSSVYHHIHGIVGESAKRLKAQLGDTDPIVVMAHSLGAHIMSNYLWDHQHKTDSGIYTPIPTLVGFITFGCNIPLFSLSFPVAKPINLPGEGVKKRDLIDASRWKNFLDVDDVLGWPIRPLYEKNRADLNAAQRATVDRMQDFAINVGPVLQSWNPASHSEYWEDNDFTIPAARYLSDLVKALDA